MQQKIDGLARRLAEQGIPYQSREPMSRHTTFQVGGPAALFLEPANTEQIILCRRLCRDADIALFPIGRGSNLLVPDTGLSCAVLHLGSNYRGILRLDNNTVEAKSGTKLSKLCRATADQGLSGLEFGYGIPGSVGGVVYMNAGAYGGEMKNVVRSVTFLDEEDNIRTLSGEALDFRYRHSVFSGGGKVILSARMEFTHDDPEAIKAEMDEYMTRRREKQPLEYGSAGSTFKRPEGAYAAALIDQCGLKGFRIGGAQVSEKHAGFVVNVASATCADVLAVMGHVSTTVLEKTGFQLDPEIMLLP